MIFDKRLAVTGAAVAVVAATAIVGALFPLRQEEARQAREPVSGIQTRNPAAAPSGANEKAGSDDYLYLLREYEGKVALFARGSQTPQLVFERPVRHLPEYDQMLLEDGIKINSDEELVARIEDYIS